MDRPLSVCKLDISSRIEKSFVGRYRSITSILYFKNHRRLVTSSIDKLVRIWNVDTCVCDKVIDLGYMVLYLIKFGTNEELFLTCTTSAEICSYSIITLERVKKIYNHTRGFGRMLKLTEDLFLAEADDLMVIRYSTGKLYSVMAKQEKEILGSCLVLSKKFKNCFYMNTSFKDNYKIKQIDYEKNEVVNVFSDHDDAVFTMTLFTNPRDEEILLAFQGISSFRFSLFFYKVERRKSECNKCVRHINLGTGNDVEKVSCCMLVRERFLFFSQNSGVLSLIDLENDSNEIIRGKKFHSKAITGIINMEILSNKDLRIACIAYDDASVIRVSGLELENGNDKYIEDLEDRIDFLWKFIEKESDFVSKLRMVVSQESFVILRIFCDL